MVQLVARSTVSRCVVGSSPRGAEHFSFPPTARRLGNQRPWYVQPRLCEEKIPCHLSEREGDCLTVVGFLYSFIHQVIIITGLNKLYSRMLSP